MIATAVLMCVLAQNVVRYEPKEADLKYVFGAAEPVATVKPGRHHRHQDVRLLRQRHPEAGRHARQGQGRQPADRAVLRRGRRARRHAGREDPRADGRQQPGRRRARARVRRAQHHQLHADAPRAGAGEDLVLPDRPRQERSDVHRARLELLDEDPAASVSRLPRRRARARVAQLGGAGRARRQHGRAGGQRRQHRLLPRQRPRRAALPRRRPRADGRRRDRRHRDRGADARAAAGRRHQGPEDRLAAVRERAARSWRSAPTVRSTTRCGSRSPS